MRVPHTLFTYYDMMCCVGVDHITNAGKGIVDFVSNGCVDVGHITYGLQYVGRGIVSLCGHRLSQYMTRSHTRINIAIRYVYKKVPNQKTQQPNKVSKI